MSAEKLQTLHQRHVRHSADRAGYGLGLSIVHTIVEKQHAQLELYSPPPGARSGLEARIVLEEAVGPVPVVLRAEEGRPVFAQLTAAKLPEVGPAPPSIPELAEMLSLDPADLLEGVDGADAPEERAVVRIRFGCGCSYP